MPSLPLVKTVGVFDSGVGGLSVLRALRRCLPEQDYIYLGDTARLPYGTRSEATVERYALQAASQLVGAGIDLLVVACNTASAVALPALQRAFAPLPVLGVVKAGARAAAERSSTGRIAIVATEGTVRGGAYQREILALRPGARLYARACGLFVALAEEGLLEGAITREAVLAYLDAWGPWVPDTLVLGCTHFPPLRPAIEGALGERFAIVDSAETTAQQVLLGHRWKPGSGTLQYLATDGPERFARVGSRFLGEAIDPAAVRIVDL